MGRKNRQCKPEPFKCCSHDGSPTALVLESYIPADDYFICEGSRWTPQ